jgi:SAM-dependent methyltransferase
VTIRETPLCPAVGEAGVPQLSDRLRAVVDALPLQQGIRVLEVGCGPGAAAREVARRIGSGHVVGIDRSAAAIAQALAGSRAEIEAGVLSFRRVRVEDFELEQDEAPFDLAFALRVGALDGRHPEAGRQALARLRAALAPAGRLLIDGGDPLREVLLLRAGGRTDRAPGPYGSRIAHRAVQFATRPTVSRRCRATWTPARSELRPGRRQAP